MSSSLVTELHWLLELTASFFAFGLAQFFPSASFFAYFGLSAFSLAVFLPLRASCLS
jgi:hypothetical protein